jgi:hypothetical protein
MSATGDRPEKAAPRLNRSSEFHGDYLRADLK